ncbi:hypothetical protein [Hoyosella altamirensis]|uniref:Uncharacterized protein n=1 Tax=Hoyosella altamirensis TaxID=616997 RepID=A0A839RQW3_9ACTN|nr:hypothetical protein [Hoyosella altamirensis]MBB3038486.1 hypothetical protein [Hoyosella altamirensis]
MFTAAAFIPGPPLLVPELANEAASETADLRRAVLDVAAALAETCDRWIAVGTDTSALRNASNESGTFRGFGVDVTVSLGPESDRAIDADMPLPALIAGWVRGQSAPALRCDMEYLQPDTPAESALSRGEQLRRQIDAVPERVGALIVADGATTLTDRAPGAFDPRAEDFERTLSEALDSGATGTLATLDVRLCCDLGVSARAAWQVLAALFTGTKPGRVMHRFDSAPYGVGYHVGMWLP